MSASRGRGFMLGMVVAALLCDREAAAQGALILPETRSIQAGPVSLFPTIALRDVGIDSNVFNDAVGRRGDFTYSVTPLLYATASVGSTRFVGRGLGAFTYYQTYKDQQSLSGLFDVRYEVVSPGFRPFVSAGFADRRERRGYEIDARLRQRQVMASVGADFDVTPITALTAWANRTVTRWERDAEYLGMRLAEELDHTTSMLAAGARFKATPLTTIALLAEVQADRFARSPLRDGDSIRIGPRVDFDSTAAVAGRLAAGYRSLKPLNSSLAGFSGFTASTQMHYRFRDWAAVEVEAERDVDFSYDRLQPYFLQTGGRLEVTQRLVGPLQVIAVGDRRDLHYQMLGEPGFTGRHETTSSVGGGFAMQLSKHLRLEMVYERTSRVSDIPESRGYERRRVIATASYGQ